ncbi:MAG: DNA replication and repair protein RecF [Flavobacteriales bacterium]|nr:MAG: DNA replication and repair protein RecF [Flavobacteriales bacterium]
MHLQKLSIVNFKNYEQAELEFSEDINCFVGNNGEGKTNMLDAIYYLSFTKSFFNPIDSQNILHDAPFFVVQGEFASGKKVESIYCGIKKGEKKQFKRNKKLYKKLAEHIGLLPLVMISPADSELITEGSEVRRKFVDGVISQYNKQYLENLLNYNKVLAHRNALLKHFAETRSFDATSIEVWDNRLVEFGQPIHTERKKFIEDFIPIFQRYFEEISQGNEKVSLEYNSQINDDSFMQLLIANSAKDRARQHTSVGIHKDDLVFKLGGSASPTTSGFAMKKFGSQGQQKTYLLALKLAKFEYIKSIKKLTPLLLLDDIFDKLDALRAKALMELVSRNGFGQIFITDTNEQRITELLKEIGKDFSIFRINNGKVK